MPLLAALLPGLTLGAGGCAQPSGDLRVRMEAYDPADRIRAIVEVVRRNDRDAVPALVDRLDDDDAAVRLYAIVALEKLTGTREGYSYAAAPVERRRSIERWRSYLKQRAESVGDGPIKNDE